MADASPDTSQNTDFDALIHLLTTDDDVAAPSPVHLSGPPTQPGSPQTRPSLRHPDGRFDFDRIRDFFEHPTGSTQGVNPLDLADPQNDFGESGKYASVFAVDDGLPQAQAGEPHDPSPPNPTHTLNMHSNPAQRHGRAPSSPHMTSISPLTLPPVEALVRPQSEPPQLGGSSAASARLLHKMLIASPPIFTSNTRQSEMLSSPSSQAFSETAPSPIDLALLADKADLIEALHRTLVENQKQTEALNQALQLAKAETADLNRQCSELRSLIEDMRLGGFGDTDHGQSLPRPRRPQDRLTPQPHETTTSETSESGFDSPRDVTDANGHSLPLDEIDLMRSDDLRRTFKALLSCLNLSSIPHAMVTAQSDYEAPPLRSLQDIMRAISFVRYVDQLVWKTSGRISRLDDDGRDKNVFGEENIKGLEDRLKLWERAVRNPIHRKK